MEPVAQLIEPNISKSTSATPGPLSSQVTGADTIEVKMTVANAQIGDALRKFDLRVDEEEKRYVYFFDTPERDLLEAGIIARARRIVGDQHNSTVKFRPVDPGALSRRWRKFEGFKIEADASEKGVDKSVSLTRPVKRGLIRRAVEGEGKVRHLFKKEHGDFLSDIGRKAINKALGRDTIDFDTLTIFGPIMAHRWEFCYAGCPWPINSELWVRCDRDRLMELSIRCPASHAAFATFGFRGLLDDIGVQRDIEAKSKTRWALYKPVSPVTAAAPKLTDGPAGTRA